MSQLVLNRQDSPMVLEPLIRQIVREELAKLVELEQPGREQVWLKISVPSETERESRREELKTFFAQFQADVTGYWFNREEANER